MRDRTTTISRVNRPGAVRRTMLDPTATTLLPRPRIHPTTHPRMAEVDNLPGVAKVPPKYRAAANLITTLMLRQPLHPHPQQTIQDAISPLLVQLTPQIPQPDGMELQVTVLAPLLVPLQRRHHLPAMGKDLAIPMARRVHQVAVAAITKRSPQCIKT